MKRTNAVANAIIVYWPLAIVALLVVAANPLLLTSFIVFAYMLGLVNLIKSKINVFRQQQWLSFGSSNMDAKNRTRYRRGYVTIATAAVFNILAITLTRM